MSKTNLENSIRDVLEDIPKICQNVEFEDELSSTLTKFEFKNSFFTNDREIKCINFKLLFSNLEFKKNWRNSAAYDDLMNVITKQSKKFKNLRNNVFSFIPIYFEHVGKLEFSEKIFLFLFNDFYESVILENNIYFSPLFKFELPPSTKSTKFGKIELGLINEFDYKIIKEHHVGKFGNTPGYLYRVNSTIRLRLDANEKNPDSVAQNMFDKFLYTCHLFDTGNVSYGTIFKNYYYFDPNKPAIISQKTPVLLNPTFNVDSVTKFKKFFVRFDEIDFNDFQLEFLLVAIKKFSSSITKIEPVDKIIDLFITLEALFSSPGETSFKIAFRAALFLGTDEEEYENILKFIQPLYALRNDILHGKKLVDEQDLFQLEEFEKLLRKSILGFLKIHTYYKTNKDSFSKNKTFKKYVLDYLDKGLINRNYLEPLRKHTQKKSI